MPFPAQPRYVAALSKRMRSLQHADDRRDEDAVWELTCEVLGWLYRADQMAQAHDNAYLTKRATSEPGRTLAGLIWMRGRVDHHAAQVRSLIWKRATLHVFNGTDWKPAPLNVYDGAKWKPAELSTASAVWPARDEIPVGARERHGRDLLYDEHVAHKELLSPLRVAQTFIEAV